MPEDSKNNELPKPEVLKPHGEKAESADKGTDAAAPQKSGKKSLFDRKFPKRTTYRPSHKATFIGLGVVAVVLLINAGIVYFVLQAQQGDEDSVNRSEVTLTTDNLNELGVSRNPIGDLGSELTIGPDANFNGTVSISGNTTIGGTLTLNGQFSAADGAFSNLQGGETQLETLNVNGDTTTSNLNVRQNLAVAGSTTLQGSLTISQLTTVNNNLNVTGSLAVGGTLAVRNLSVASLTTDTTLTIGGKVITRGSAPSVSAGGGVGSSGTVSISGTDTAGTVAVNVGVGSTGGTLANVTFRSAYGSTPRVLVTAIGRNAGDVYVNRNANGFSINVGGALSPGGYAFDYWIVQ